MLKEKDERARRPRALSCSQTQIYIQIIQTLRFEFRIILKPSLCYGNLLHVCPPPKTWGKVGRFQKCPTYPTQLEHRALAELKEEANSYLAWPDSPVTPSSNPLKLPLWARGARWGRARATGRARLAVLLSQDEKGRCCDRHDSARSVGRIRQPIATRRQVIM